jgi:hypothetical protein
MFQIYFLTVLANCLAGFIIADSFFREKEELCGSILDLFAAPNVRLTVGLLTLLVGIISLFKSSPGDILFLGDLLPSLGAIVGGLAIGASALGEKTEEPPGMVKVINDLTDTVATPLGLGIMVIGILHAIIPTAIIL